MAGTFRLRPGSTGTQDIYQDGESVATFWGRKDKQAAITNARLFMAAPALLRLVRQYRADLEQMHEDYGQPVASERMAEIDALIRSIEKG